MSQFNYEYPLGQVGQVANYAPNGIRTITNPLRAQVTNLEYNGITTDGDYSLTFVGSDGSSATSDVFAASGSTAAQICAGIVAGVLSNAESRGLVSAAAVVTTDNVEVTFQKGGVIFTVTPNVPGAAPTQSNTTSAGYTLVSPGVILQADGSGGFTTTYTDGALAFGVTCRNADFVNLTDSTAGSGFDGPTEIGVLYMGNVYVQVASGVTVSKGNKVYFNPTAATWSNATTGSHVLVEGSQWQTTGTGIQITSIRLPSET